MSGKRNWGDNMTNRMDGKVYPEPFDDAPKPVPSRFWRSKFECKKNKGDHTYEIDHIRVSHFRQDDDGTWRKDSWQTYWVVWRCTGCKKKEYEWKPPVKSFDKYRHTIWGV